MFDCINFKHFEVPKMKCHKRQYQSKQCKGEQNHLFLFWIKKFQPIKDEYYFNYLYSFLSTKKAYLLQI